MLSPLGNELPRLRTGADRLRDDHGAGPRCARRTRHRRPGGAVAVAAVVALASAACSQADPQWQELGGWERIAVWEHQDVSAYDRVATTSGPGGAAWFTWARGRDDALAYVELLEDGEATGTILSLPRDPVAIPVGVHADGDGWVTVAVTRQRPNGDNTGLVAWQSATTPGRTGAVAPRRLSAAERGLGVPTAVNAGRAAGVDVVAGLVGGEAVAWASAEGGRWERAMLDLGLDADLAALDLSGDGEQLLLGGVDDEGGAHLWTSTDGLDWQEVGGDLPSGVSSVTMLAPAGDGELALAWIARGDSEAVGPRLGDTATIQVFDGDGVSDEGTIEADPDDGVAAFSLNGAAVSPDGRLLVVGTAMQGPSPGTSVPMVWGRDGDTWQASTQPELTDRLDHEFRTAVTTGDQILGVVTPSSLHIDVEVWRWRPDG